MEEDFLLDLWVRMRNYIPAKQREEAAFQFAEMAEDAEMNLKQLLGSDPYLDKVVEEIIGDVDEDDELEFEDY